MTAADPPVSIVARWQPLLAGLAGMLLLWLAQPTLSWWPLAWLAPLPWLWMATRAELPGRRPYRQLWLAGAIYWLAALYWIPMAHPLQYFNWPLLSGYLGVYLPLQVKLIRVAIHKYSVPLWLAAPVAAVACDYAMAHVITGIAMATPVHTQVDWLAILQCVDLAGPYALTFAMMLVPAAIVTAANSDFGRWQRVTAPVVAAGVMIAALAYGHSRLAETAPADAPTIRVAIIQGNEPAVWEADANRDERVMKQYNNLTARAVESEALAGRRLDWIVWPESMFRIDLWQFDPGFETPAFWVMASDEVAAAGPQYLSDMANNTGANLLFGLGRMRGISGDESLPQRRQFQNFNSAAVVTRDGAIVDVYDKRHLVLCGEYLPFADLFPWVYDIAPMGLAVTPGDRDIAPLVESVRISPNICYESVLPHVIRRKVVALDAREERPDLLANLTNDSWFRKSSELDMHLACNILRAVENRTPMVVAANGGLSASIDRWGRVLAVTQKQTAEFLIVDVVPGAGSSPYHTVGDWPALACAALCVAMLVVTFIHGRRIAHPDEA